MRRWLITGATLLLIGICGGLFYCQEGGASQRQRVPLDAQTMKAALRTETPEEQGYIDEVLRRVERGQLPRSLVEATFVWARQRPEHRFQYFRRALRLQAARLGFSAP